MFPTRISSGIRFQSTPPGWEATFFHLFFIFTPRLFQSTPPGWEATKWFGSSRMSRLISIHASRVGGDVEQIISINFVHYTFQSTPPGWEATAKIYEEWSDSLEFLLNSPRGYS